jgi:hypothetical protein
VRASPSSSRCLGGPPAWGHAGRWCEPQQQQSAGAWLRSSAPARQGPLR